VHITKIEIENIKSHVEFVQDFLRGTTAIVGENGAGKTTIIEAVAWTLFDLLDYRKEDFLRRGARKGWVRISFESSVDERRYQVYRDTGTGYHVFDPELGIRIADKKDEVSRFLRLHLGVEPGTDLKVLFRAAIGVPQGTFTTVFADNAARKQIFDKLLKVDEYRFGSDRLRDTSRFLELRIGEVKETIARSEGELSRSDAVESELKEVKGRATELLVTVESVRAEVNDRKTKVAGLDAVESQLNSIKTEADRIENARSKAEFILGQREAERAAALAAAERLNAAEPDFEAHRRSLGLLRELERERVERDRIRQATAQIESAASNVAAARKRIGDDLERITKARDAAAELRPKAAEQDELDAERDRLRAEIARSEPSEAAALRLGNKVEVLRKNWAAQKAEVEEQEKKAKAAEELPALESSFGAVTKRVADLRAQLAADERFQREIRDGLCPVLSAKCLNLKEGQTLDGFVRSKFDELRAAIAGEESALGELNKRLAAAREAQRLAAQLEVLRKHLEEIKAEGVSVGDELKAREAEAANLPQLRSRLSEVESRLAALANPKARLIALESEIAREPDLRRELNGVESDLARLDNDLRVENEKLVAFKDLDARWAAAAAERDRTESGHRDYLANETAARSVGSIEEKLAESRAELERAAEESKRIAAELATVSAGYDRERHQLERTELFDAERRAAESGANLANAQARAAQLEADLVRLAAVREEMQVALRNREKLEKVHEASEFIRATLKKSGPLVARNYVYHISLEAAQMFREITGNPERNLKWTEEYAIVLEEGGFERPFAVLSGGEQMAAALSVRLALLKQLSDIRLAFFDEPTTNMDAVRRERLAEQIAVIGERKTFDQLFVISHDDTFENFADSVVEIGENEK